MNRTPGEKFPMRINQYLAHHNHATRRGADDLIVRKKVFINGRLAVLGDKVHMNDVVEVRGATPKQYVYFAYNKPKGVVTHSAEEGQEDIADHIGHTLGNDVFPVGRLDRDSYGLIILTNDGRVTDRLLNPLRAHDKEYAVKVREKLRDSFKKHMEAGVDIDGYLTKPAKVRVTGDYAFSITLTEGKKHQIRRMVVALHNETVDLKRVRVMNIELGNLKSGQHRLIEGEELAEFLKNLGL
jgi:23S rRNA pseudouridine2604 synthase